MTANISTIYNNSPRLLYGLGLDGYIANDKKGKFCRYLNTSIGIVDISKSTIEIGTQKHCL